MSEKSIRVRTQKFMKNALLSRKQFVVDVTHPGRGPVPKKELAEILASKYNVKDPKCVFLFGFKTQFGGGRSRGFGLIYDTLDAAKKTEPKYRLVRNELATRADTSRKQIKERKNRAKKVRGKKKSEILGKK